MYKNQYKTNRFYTRANFVEARTHSGDMLIRCIKNRRLGRNISHIFRGKISSSRAFFMKRKRLILFACNKKYQVRFWWILNSSDSFPNFEFRIYKFLKPILSPFFQLANWEKKTVLDNKKFVFFFKFSNWEKIGEIIWWNRYFSSKSCCH